MRTLTTNRPLMILMVGIPGAGKSHFARQFSELFNTPLVSFDKIHFTLFSEPQFSKEEDVLVASMMNIQIKELLKSQRSFIVDGALNTKAARLELAKLARQNDYGLLVVWVQTDHDSAKFRAIRRSLKRPGDQHNFSLSDEQFDAYAKRINPPSDREEHVVISGKHTFASQAKAVLKKIVTPREISVPVIERAQSGEHNRRPQKRVIS